MSWPVSAVDGQPLALCSGIAVQHYVCRRRSVESGIAVSRSCTFASTSYATSGQVSGAGTRCFLAHRNVVSYISENGTAAPMNLESMRPAA